MSFAGFGFGALGKLVGNLSDTYGSGDKLRDEKREEARDDYLFNERMGIQARVEGAKAAGLHPLAAIGFQAGQGPSTFVGSDPVPYSHYEGAKAPPRDPTIDRFNEARAREAEASADLRELEAHDAYRRYTAGLHALGSQPGNPPGTSMPTSPANLTSAATVKPGIKVVPDEVTAGKGGLTAGEHPAATVVQVPGIGRVTVPSGKFNEALEDSEMAKLAFILSMNRSRLAEFFVDDVPWAAKGYLQDLRKLVGLPPAKGVGRSRRSGGATGSW